MIPRRTLDIDKDALRVWLAQQPEDRTYHVKSGGKDPIATYLQEARGLAYVFVGYDYVLVEEGSSRKDLSLPKWAQQFVREFDHGYDYGHQRTTRETLELLDSLEGGHAAGTSEATH